MNNSDRFQFDEKGELVYFVCDTKELFGINLDSAGIYEAIKVAFQNSKRKSPVKTGLMRSSYSLKRLNNHSVMCYFDPQKILGKKRLGKIVNVYYPKYLSDKSKTRYFLQNMMLVFYNSLKAYVIKYNNESKQKIMKSEKIDTEIFYKFLSVFNKTYKKSILERIKEIQEAKR